MKKYKFKATIADGTGGGAYVVFPYDVQQEFGTRGRVAVKATFDGVPYEGSLIKYGVPQHILPVLKAIREKTGKNVGDALEVVLWRDEGERTVEIPDDLAAMMHREGLTPFFEGLSLSHRREYVRWITEAKREETRAKRLEKAVQMMHEKIKTPD
jgi:Domain of unknown function (DUF1905)/Bacteriocin-protection, YdeI or OmpD-Associated